MSSQFNWNENVIPVGHSGSNARTLLHDLHIIKTYLGVTLQLKKSTNPYKLFIKKALKRDA